MQQHLLLMLGQALLIGCSLQYGFAASEPPPAALQLNQSDAVVATQEKRSDEPAQIPTITPATGTPATGTPATGTPATGIPATGTPATGTQEAGSLETGTPEGEAVEEEAPRPQRSPGQLMRSLFATFLKNRIPGQPRSLVDILEDVGGPGDVGTNTLSRREQTDRIQAYWDLSAAIAQDGLVQLERIELQALHAGIQNPGVGWQQVFANNQDHAQLTRGAALVAQYKLQQLTRDIRPQVTIADEVLPVPANQPHCGVYDTHYDQIFQNRPSEFAWQLHELLGNQHQQLVRLAEAVEAASEHCQQVSRMRSVQSNGSELLRAHENLKLQRRQFMTAVHHYNRTIADYTQLALPKSVNAQQLVAMLIYVEPSKPSNQEVPETSQEGQPEIERTSGGLGLPAQLYNGHGPAQSYNGPAQSNDGPISKEHSILVPGGR